MRLSDNHLHRLERFFNVTNEDYCCKDESPSMNLITESNELYVQSPIFIKPSCIKKSSDIIRERMYSCISVYPTVYSMLNTETYYCENTVKKIHIGKSEPFETYYIAKGFIMDEDKNIIIALCNINDLKGNYLYDKLYISSFIFTSSSSVEKYIKNTILPNISVLVPLIANEITLVNEMPFSISNPDIDVLLREKNTKDNLLKQATDILNDL